MTESEPRIPPYSAEAELSVLGSIMLDNDAMGELAGVVQTDDFYSQQHQLIFAAMCELAARHQPIDVGTLGQHIKDQGNMAIIGGLGTLATLSEGIITAANIRYHAEIVRNKAHLRRVIYAMQERLAQAYGQVTDVQEYLVETRQQVVDATTAIVQRGPRRIDDELGKVVVEATSGQNPEGAEPTGFQQFDRTYGGVWKGLVSVFAGRPSSGKSVLALNLCFNVAQRNETVMYISLEDLFVTAQRRALARCGTVSLTRILLNQAQGDEASRMVDAFQLLQEVPLWVDDQPHTALEICQLAAQWKRNHNLKMLVVDHLGYVKTGEKEYEANTHTMRMLCDLAKELDIPVVLLVQLNRQCELRSKMGVPQMSDLRGSGRIEEDARGIVFVYRPAQYDPENEDPYEMRLLIKKWTNGPVGTVTQSAHLDTMTIAEYEYSDEDGTDTDEY